MVVYHTTTKDRLLDIMAHGLLPGSLPTWFTNPAPYVMVSKNPWRDLNGVNSVVLTIDLPVHDDDFESDGIRWPYIIPPELIETER